MIVQFLKQLLGILCIDGDPILDAGEMLVVLDRVVLFPELGSFSKRPIGPLIKTELDLGHSQRSAI